jgi:hypothetical protein
MSNKKSKKNYPNLQVRNLFHPMALEKHRMKTAIQVLNLKAPVIQMNLLAIQTKKILRMNNLMIQIHLQKRIPHLLKKAFPEKIQDLSIELYPSIHKQSNKI